MNRNYLLCFKKALKRLSALSVLSGCILFTCLLSAAKAGQAPAPRTSLPSERIEFLNVTVGVSSTALFYIQNTGTADLVISSLKAEPPFNLSRFKKVSAIAPGDIGIIEMVVTPQEAGRIEGTLTLQTNDPNRKRLVIPILAESIEPVAELTGKDVRLTARQIKKEESETGVSVEVVVELASVVTNGLPGTVELSLAEGMPAGSKAVFNPKSLPLGEHGLAHVLIRIPKDQTRKKGYEPGIIGEVVAQPLEPFEVFAPIGMFDDGIYLGRAPLDICQCDGTPRATLNPKASMVKGYPHDSDPTINDAIVTFTVEGPKAGECCVDGLFRSTLTIDSMVNGKNNNMTTMYFDKKQLFKTSAKTSPSPGNPFGDTITTTPKKVVANARVVATTQHNVWTKCEGAACLCNMKKDFVTEFDLSNNNGFSLGKIKVFWSVVLEGGGFFKNCAITSANATINNMVMFHFKNVFEPVKKKWIMASGDEDGDGVSNEDEIIKGNSPY